MTIKYFNHCKTLDQLKQEYKRLAKIHHPDCGGDDATMAAINAEYDELARKLPKETATGETYQPRDEEREAPEKFREAVAATLKHVSAFSWAGPSTSTLHRATRARQSERGGKNHEQLYD
jgi:curved DNA-binding protein CbpA